MPGPAPTPVEKLKARGSRRPRTQERAAQREANRKPPREVEPFKPLTRRKLEALARGLPGYDPNTQAGGSWLEPKAANAALRFFHERLSHVEGALAGKPFELEPWQQALIVNLFGWLREDRKGRIVRRYREAFVYVPRKNGKTPMAAGICLFVLFEDGEAGAQIISAAAEREQASLLYRHARGMVENDENLSGRAKVYAGIGQRSIVLASDEASSYRVISADAFSKHGFNLHCGIVDELHAQPDRELVDVLQTGLASENRTQPLMVYVTTADFNRPSICNEKLDYAKKVRDNVIPDPSFLPVIYEAESGDDWTDPKVWARVNPNLGVSVSLDYLERECGRAKETPAYENTFKRLHLNMRTEQDVRALPMDRWDACDPINDDLKGRECFGGLDLSSTTDLSALALLFPDDEGGYDVLPFFWAPKEGARRRERTDRVPYETWAREGHLKLTEGDVVDYDVIRADIGALAKKYNIREIAVDRWNATQLTTQLMGDGVEMVMFGQGFASMTAPTKDLLKLVTAGTLRHGGHPVLRWMAANLATESDAAGNLKPSKKKSTERIDGCVAVIMGLGRAALRGEPGSVYDSRGVDLVGAAVKRDETPVEDDDDF